MIKTIKCPKCNHSTTIEGNPEETKEIECPNCGLKGKFTFPKEIESPQVIEEIVERPLGITILAVFQIIAIIISIVVLIAIPLIFFEPMNDFFGLPLVGILFLYSLFMLPISLLLAYGLFIGEEWARFALVLIEITSVIASIIRFNLISAIIPFIIILYLYQPHVKKYFRTEQGLTKNIKAIIIVGFAILLIFDGWIAFVFSPFNMHNIVRDKLFEGVSSTENASVTVSGTSHRIKILLSKGGDNAPYIDQTGDCGFDIFINGTILGRDNWSIDGEWGVGESIILTQNEIGETLIAGTEYGITVQIMGTTIYDAYITVSS